jgi:hypothetical protein
MAENNDTGIPAIPEPQRTSVKLDGLVADLRDTLTAAQEQLTAYAALRSAVQGIIIDTEAGALRTPVDIIRELRRALDAERTEG